MTPTVYWGGVEPNTIVCTLNPGYNQVEKQGCPITRGQAQVLQLNVVPVYSPNLTPGPCPPPPPFFLRERLRELPEGRDQPAERTRRETGLGPLKVRLVEGSAVVKDSSRKRPRGQDVRGQRHEGPEARSS